MKSPSPTLHMEQSSSPDDMRDRSPSPAMNRSPGTGQGIGDAQAQDIITEAFSKLNLRRASYKPLSVNVNGRVQMQAQREREAEIAAYHRRIAAQDRHYARSLEKNQYAY